MNKSLSWRCLALCAVLIAIVPNVKAIDLPGIGTINLPSFRYGKLKRDREVNIQFQSYKVMPGYTYYTSLPAKCQSASGELVRVEESPWKITPGP